MFEHDKKMLNLTKWPFRESRYDYTSCREL